MISVREQKEETLPTPEVVQIPNINNTTDALKAYSLCYDEEQRLLQQQETGRPLTNIRILGYMFIHNSGSSMLTELTRAVTSCFQVPDGHAKRLNDLGQFFLDYWIRPCKCTLSYLHSLVLNFSRSSYHGANTLLVSSKQTVVRAQGIRDFRRTQASL